MARESSKKELLNKGQWSPDEDLLLIQYVETHGERRWATVSKRTGLLRGGKSCRLRWKNYLRPNLKRERMSEEEEDLIIRLHSLLGNRWALIAGRLPGRTDNEVKNYWNTHLVKRTNGPIKKSLPPSPAKMKKKMKMKQRQHAEGSSAGHRQTITNLTEGERKLVEENADQGDDSTPWMMDNTNDWFPYYEGTLQDSFLDPVDFCCGMNSMTHSLLFFPD